MDHSGARQCHYCNNYFIKNEEKMKKYLSTCSAKAGFTFAFDNGKIIDYQEYFKSLGDVLFSIIMTLKQLQEVLFFRCKNICCELLYDCCFSSRA